jgi:hypothetical protein
MSDNSITIKVSLSDDLLKKVAGLLAPAPTKPVGIPASLLAPLMAGALAPPSDDKKSDDEKPTIGFKVDK